ncbi:MAG: phosphate ABC transporter substrate-binding protein [Erysipelotrichaceae bacterium]|nr:phosphate ABC transporter substrate-binding protein [Erysipelotrichaceae bacterium]
MKKLGALLLAFALSFSLVGCGSNSSSSDDSATTSNEDISGTVTMDGSTSMEELVNGLAEAIKEVYPNLTIEPQFTGSGTGIQSVADGKVDIGNSSRALKDEELAEGLVENIVALDGIAVIVNEENTVTNLTTNQLVSIYTGEISNWSEVGGEDEAIVVIGRESSSGTRGAFEEILGVEDACNYAQEINSTGAVVAGVQSTAGAIGYVSLEAISDATGIAAVQLDGVECNTTTIADGSYTLQRPFVMATKGEISEQSETVQAVFTYLESDAGQELIESFGLVVPTE